MDMEYTSYVTRQRARFKAMCGEQVNIPYGTAVEAHGGVLTQNGKALCLDTSQNAYDYFSQNDDGRGQERGDLVTAITKLLEKQDAEHQARWDKVWDSALCQKYRRPEHKDFFLWGRAFYDAPVEDLRQIAALIGATVKTAAT